MAVATKESTLRREVIVRMLADHGAMLPPVHDKAQWLANVRGWAIKVIEEPRRNASERGKTLRGVLLRFSASEC